MFASRLILIVLLVICMVFVGLVGITSIPRSEYDYYPGLSSEIYDYGTATRNSLLFFSGWASLFTNQFEQNKKITFELYLITLTRHIVRSDNIEKVTPVYVLVYLPQNTTTDNVNDLENYYYKIYGFNAPEDSTMDYYIRTKNKYFLAAKSWITGNGDYGVGGAKYVKENHNLIYRYKYTDTQYPDTEFLNKQREWYTFATLSIYNSQVNINEFYLIKDYEN